VHYLWGCQMKTETISPHLRERFFQRYYQELTAEILAEIVGLAAKNHLRSPGQADPDKPGVYHTIVAWRGQGIKIVWHPEKRMVLTFLAPHMKKTRSSKDKVRA
jgi:hypothetical protein